MLGEGEATLAEIVKRLISKKENNINSLVYEDLISIDGIAFSRKKFSFCKMHQRLIYLQLHQALIFPIIHIRLLALSI